MIFTKEHSKLKNTFFTTIRKNMSYYQVGNTYTVMTPSEKFKVRVRSIVPLKKSDITDGIAFADADMTADELRSMLENWYGKQYDDFVLIRLVRKEAKEMSIKKEKLRQDLAECKAVRPVHAGSTDADYQFRDRVNKVIDLFLDWLDFELTER